MNSKEAVDILIHCGFSFLRRGKGDHLIYQKGDDRIVIPNGKTELSPGMSGKVRSKMYKATYGPWQSTRTRKDVPLEALSKLFKRLEKK